MSGIREFRADALSIAKSLGRLDLISFWLTILGVLLTVAALIGYKFVRSEAKDIAKDIATKIARETSEGVTMKVLGEKEQIRESKERKSSPGGQPRDSILGELLKKALSDHGEN